MALRNDDTPAFCFVLFLSAVCFAVSLYVMDVEKKEYENTKNSDDIILPE